MLLALACSGAGCGGFMARRLAQAPNTYPQWLAPKAPVVLEFASPLLTNFPARFVSVGPPDARLRYRLVEPRNYGVRVSSTNWMENQQERFKFSFRATIPGEKTAFTDAPCGTVVLLHGYGISMTAMAPWALRLAQEGWRCVLVDLRGHGQSTGERIFYGIREVHDLSQLLDELGRQGKLKEPVGVIGESYGASLALRWKISDSRLQTVVAMAPYAELATAVLNIRREYAAWFPESCIKAGLNKLPATLQVAPGDLDLTSTVAGQNLTALFVAGGCDAITPVTDVQRLFYAAAPASSLLIVPDARHEALPFDFERLTGPVLGWLAEPSLSIVGGQ